MCIHYHLLFLHTHIFIFILTHIRLLLLFYLQIVAKRDWSDNYTKWKHKDSKLKPATNNDNNKQAMKVGYGIIYTYKQMCMCTYVYSAFECLPFVLSFMVTWLLDLFCWHKCGSVFWKFSPYFLVDSTILC